MKYAHSACSTHFILSILKRTQTLHGHNIPSIHQFTKVMEKSIAKMIMTGSQKPFMTFITAYDCIKITKIR